MRNPKVVLNNLASKAQDEFYVFERLYRNLYNTGFYLDAYSKLYPNKERNGISATIDERNVVRIDCLIKKLKAQTYQPELLRRICRRQKNDTPRSLGILTFEDKLVQEVVRQILESIYEPQFSEHSHGFRPSRSCHTALKEVCNTFTGAKWFIEGDIKGSFANMDHHLLIGLLRKRIKDEKLINLIWKFLRAGCTAERAFYKTYNRIPQGSIIGPLLSNIYLHELDKYAEQFALSFHKEENHRHNPAYDNLVLKVNDCKRIYECNREGLTMEERAVRIDELNALYKELYSLDRKDPFGPNYRRINYVRYADDFIIGVIGSKRDAVQIEKAFTVFLADKLKIERNIGNARVIHSQKKARFLEYDIRTAKDWHKLNRAGNWKYTCHTKLLVPKEIYVQKLIRLGALKMNNAKGWKPVHRPYLVHLDDAEILRTYNAEIEEIYHYYQLAGNLHVLQNFQQTMKYSMIKTYANKYKSTVSKIIPRFTIKGKFGVRFQTKNGPKTLYFIKK